MLEKTTAVMGQITDDGIATSSTSELHATWTPATDPESGVTKYEYLIRQDSTSGPVIVNYTSVGLATEVTKTGLNLISGKTYYIGVRAHNGAGLYSPPTYSNGIIVDTVAPTGTIAINNGADYANSPNVTLNLTAADATSGVDQMRISVDGGQNWMIDWTDFSANPQVALQEPDGLKTVVVQLKDKAGNISSEIISDMITLDTKKPEINVLSPNATNDPNYTLVYDVDGRRVEEPQVLTEGENPLTISETDPAGNTTTLNYVVTYTPPQADGPVVLADGTTLFYQGGVLIREQTLQGDEVFYRTDGSTERYRYADGRELHYSQDVPTVIKIYDTLGALIELVDQPTPTPLDEANALKLTLEGGVEAYYMNGNLVELRTQTGIRIADFTLTAANDIEHALLVYPDGTREIIRSGVLIRRIFSDGSIMDFTPNGFAVREVLSDAIQYYQFDKLSQTEVRNTKVFTSSNASSTYDELGILREVKGSSSERFFYLRNQTTDGFVTTLDRNVSSAPQAKSLIEAHYTVQGDLTEMKFEDGTRILLSQGKITQALDAVGNPIDYSYLEEAGLLTGLRVSRSGTQFDYDALGFLETITTSGGTIHRTWQDTDGNGVLSDQDVVDILLETVGGDRLSDFELDANGNIIRGIIETKEGIKQTIENGVLTGFETVDGKIYDFQNNEAILREWRFKDGMRVLYGGGNITEILFPDQSRLHTIGFNAKKEIESFVEELPDGTKKFFENGKLVKLITPEGTEIHYDPSGLAQRIILPDLSEETVSYVRDSLGQITEITFKGQTTYRTFKPDGTLVRLLTDGVNAEVTNGNISRLFTRFGELMQPTFTQGGILSGEVSLVNGTKLIITNGELVQAVRASGTKVNYASGRIESIETQAERYRLIYGSGNDIRIRLESEQGSPEFPLIPFLQNPDALMASVQGTSIPSYPVTFYDNAQIDTTQSQFGGASARFDGSGDYLSLPDSDDWDFGTGDFTIDFWVMFNSTGGEIALVSRNVDGILIRKSSAGKLQAYVNGNDVGDGTGDWNPSTGQWYHVAVVRAGTTGKTFVDGIQIGGDSTNSVDVQGTTGIRIGMRTDDVGPLNGWMDELRISKGTAWYTTNFPLPTSEYPSDTNTKLLLHFDPPNQEPSQLSQEGSELIKILFSRPLYDALSDPARVQSGLDIGQDIFFAKIFEDVVRGRAYEFGSSFFPEWLGVSVNQSNLDQGYLGRNVVLDALGNLPQLTSTLIDINGDGLLDRVFVPESGNYWWIQLNSGSGFDQPIPWQGVDRSYDSLSPTTLGSIDFYKGTHTYQLGRLMDMNGDGLPDRILQKSDGSRDWYIQINSGSGFDPTILWASNTHPYVEPSNLATYASEVRSDEAAKDVQELVVDLIDLDGDGLPDRLLRPPLEPYNQWFWQRNTGSGFEDALIWEGVDTNFHSDPKIGGSLSWYFNVDNFREVGGFLEKIEAVILGTPPPPWETGCNINLSDMNDPCTKTWLANQSATQEIANILAQYGISREPYRTPSEQVYDLSPWSTNNKFFQRLESGFESLTGTISDLMDMNGDGLVDRVLLKNAVLNDLNSAMNWYVQFNNGQGFDPPVLWDEDVRILGNSPNNAIGSSLTVFSGWQSTKNLLVDLHDVTGDGLPDRITLDTNDRQNQPQATWWVEVNNGHTFEPAVAWTGIYGSNILETSIRQDSENFKTWDYWNQSTMFGKQVVDLRDINSDKIPDRLIFREGESRWLVQYGTGSGFLPVQEMKIESLSASTDQIRSSRYDYLHVSLKSESQISQSEGQVRIMLGDPSDPTSYQEWAVTDLGTNWKDFYLPMDSTKLNASEVKVRFEPSVAGATVPIYIDNVTFVATRPPDAKGWLDYLLTEENVLAEVYSDRNQTLAQYLGFSQADEAVSLNWDELLKAETHIAFNVQGEATDFTTSYGSVSRIENGRVVETTLPDGTRVAFSEPTPTNPQSFTQTITDSTGGVQTLNLSYGRVREVLRTGKSPLQYSYEFNTQGEEITVVFDPDSGITERYSEAAPAGGLENRLISRTQANGVETIFEYDSKGELIRSSVIYKGRVREIFEYYTSEAGNRILKTSEGVEEEYTSDGTILFHTTPEGYRYAHSFEQERDVVTQIQTETVLLPDGSSFSVDIPIVNLVDNPAGDEI
ncbi:MAG: hypothetical protein HYS55_00820, partial [Candidatus Omnitrophica bacterium]|nr:hypothetical protein [Candidatus Omnitrophota bacterium]